MKRFLAVWLITVSAFAQRKPPDTAAMERDLKRLIEIYAVAESNAAELPSPAQLLYAGAIPGMLRKLDPHSVFFDKDQFDQLKEMEKSVSKGFGSVVSILPGRVIVLQTLPGTPSQKSGLAPGDEILAINNIALSRLDMEQLVQFLSQARMNEVELYVRREGSAGLLRFTMTPEEMQAPSVDRVYEMVEGIFLIRASSFDGKTGVQLREAIEKHGGEKLKGLILDLRDNPGGVLDAALESAAMFLMPGQRILSARGRNTEEKPIDVPQGLTPYTFPVAVLINGKSASSSEIVAGALQDHDRATILGEPSFGKGLVQSVFTLSEGTGLALTTAFYYTPSGRSIQKPLHGGQLDEVTGGPGRPEYKTDKGRTVRGGGGIDPDELIFPPRPSRLAIFLEQTAAFAAFATDYTRLRRSFIDEKFEVTPAVLDEFQLFLSQRNIRPTISEWSADREWITSRVKQEIFNQTLGVVVGDEIEMRRDPVVRRAVAILSQRPIE